MINDRLPATGRPNNAQNKSINIIIYRSDHTARANILNGILEFNIIINTSNDKAKLVFKSIPNNAIMINKTVHMILESGFIL